MKTKIFLLVALPVALAFVVSGCESEKEDKIQLSSLPPVVQKTITENAGDGKIEEIEKETKTKNGKLVTVYEVEIKKSDGKEVEIKVGEGGKLIKIEDD
jgi:tryptophanyl-tRNA synthetase